MPLMHLPAARIARLFLVCSLLAVRAAADASLAPAWERVEWNGEPAWESVSGGVRAVVSEARGRLVHFGTAGENLLQAPTKREGELFWGGHRAWLGPQGDWEKPWPPPDEWEMAAADETSVAADGSLVVRMQRVQERYPALQRVHRWERPGVLGLELRWRPAPGMLDFQAIHVLQLPGEARIRMPLQDTGFLPFGYAVLEPDHRRMFILRDRDVSSVTRDAGGLWLQRSQSMLKLGFTPQSVIAHIGERRLVLEPGAVHGRIGEAPEAGLLSHVFMGDLGFTLVEIEQLSPRLAPAEDGWCGYSVRVRMEK